MLNVRPLTFSTTTLFIQTIENELNHINLIFYNLILAQYVLFIT